MNYLFVFGNSPLLAKEELTSVLARNNIAYQEISFHDHYQILECETLPIDIFKLLGGTVKVAEVFDSPIATKLTEGIQPKSRVVFGLSGEGTMAQNKEIKDELEELGFKARFVLPKRGESELSSVVVTKQMVQEVYFLGETSAKTVWVQDFEDWGKRDYGRPAAAGHVGMLPPKVARMMANIGSREQGIGNKGKYTILDPFCGVGTILAEGLMIGVDVVGSDSNAQQVAKSKKNLEWLARAYNLEPSRFSVSLADARSVGIKISPNSVDAVVTEPDLGPTSISKSQFSISSDKLLLLYTACLENWKKILKPNGKVVMVIPSFISGVDEDKSLVKILVDKAQIMGYSVLAGPFSYYRSQAVVRRNIIVFLKE